jgi:hypothetical protein
MDNTQNKNNFKSFELKCEINEVEGIEVFDVMIIGENTEEHPMWEHFCDCSIIKAMAKAATGKDYCGMFVDEPHQCDGFSLITLYSL